jgi:S-adenosylmethionine synthetase
MLMVNKNYYFTSESVSAGHPDKLCDQISDVIVDYFLEQDEMAKTAIETMALPQKVIIGGETSFDNINIAEIEGLVRRLIKKIGYIEGPFNYNNIQVEILINKQSSEIAKGIAGEEEGAGDQGIMFGYAINETPNFMPSPIFYAHKILRNINSEIENKVIEGLGPDAKSQVTIEYKNGIPVAAKNILVSTQHHPDLTQSQIKEMLFPIIVDSLPEGWLKNYNNLQVNPTGSFIVGGPTSDTGLTGRKIIVDTYGGAAPHGGGAFSGKDPSKVDRSAAYAARYLAKNIVASGMAKECTIQLSYAIGVAKPVSIYVNAHGTAIIPEVEIIEIINEHFDLTPKGIRTRLKLNRPIYLPTATYGQFGRTPNFQGFFQWEKIDLFNN